MFFISLVYIKLLLPMNINSSVLILFLIGRSSLRFCLISRSSASAYTFPPLLQLLPMHLTRHKLAFSLSKRYYENLPSHNLSNQYLTKNLVRQIHDSSNYIFYQKSTIWQMALSKSKIHWMAFNSLNLQSFKVNFWAFLL